MKLEDFRPHDKYHVAIFAEQAKIMKRDNPEEYARSFSGFDDVKQIELPTTQMRAGNEIDWSEYSNFNQWEFTCKCGCGKCEIKEEVVAMCQALRDEIDRPIGITSGYRCPDHNKALEKIGASKSSGHMDGTEVDISAIDSTLRYSILAFAYDRGVKRIGARYKSFIHLGLSETLPQNVCW